MRLEAGEGLPRETFAAIERRAIREAFAWNLTHRGAARVCDVPLVIRSVLSINATSSHREVIDMAPVLEALEAGAALRRAFALSTGTHG